MSSKTRSDATSAARLSPRSIIPPSANPDSKPTGSHALHSSRTSLSSAPPLKTLTPRKNISQFENFVMSALAPSMAVVFTLPFDTVKVRMQLQGEVSMVRDATGKPMRRVAQQVYKSSLDCLTKTFKYEGIRGLEKGLSPSILKESSKNVFRLGMYDPILNVLHPTDDEKSSRSSAPAWKRMLAGGMCGGMGAVSANPFELVKTRLQSSAAGAIAVGNQHGYNSVTSAFRRIVAGEGVAGLYRGSMISVYRSILGSATNLSTYTLLRDRALKDGYKEGVLLDMACSLVSAFVSVVFMNPLDVVRTRLYNAKKVSPIRQGTLTTISNIVATEGWMALYRGFSTHFMRIGPHFCLTFVFLEELKRGARRLHDRQYQRELQQFKKEELFRSKAELTMLKA